jgi:hypothetical protein
LIDFDEERDSFFGEVGFEADYRLGNRKRALDPHDAVVIVGPDLGDRTCGQEENE